MYERKDIAAVKDRHKEALLAKPNVVGVGTGYKLREGRREELCVVAMVTQKLPRASLPEESLVPSEVDGIATDVIQVGLLQAHPARTGRWRPALGGVSVGHRLVTAGTLGSVVRDRSTGTRLILSNNHVLAASNRGQPGDLILQPGQADGGREAEDVLARLERYAPIHFTSAPATCPWALRYARLGNAVAKLLGSKHRVRAYWSDPQAANVMDAAVARPLRDEDVLDEILEIGKVSGTIGATLGMPVRKSGRTTGLTAGQVIVLDATVNVQYGEASARFEDQIVTTAMSQPGDSGSLLVAGEALAAVGLLFAGSDQATIHNPIRSVLRGLDIEI